MTKSTTVDVNSYPYISRSGTNLKVDKCADILEDLALKPGQTATVTAGEHVSVTVTDATTSQELADQIDAQISTHSRKMEAAGKLGLSGGKNK